MTLISLEEGNRTIQGNLAHKLGESEVKLRSEGESEVKLCSVVFTIKYIHQ